MPLIAATCRSHSLVHPTGLPMYTFSPRDDGDVDVVRKTPFKREDYTMSVGEARKLWSDLCRKKYERF